jgi:ubiquinone biosynthesis protein UbiJ
MKELVERLREKPPVFEEAKEAADEIDRLRRDVKRLNTQLHFYRQLQLKREKGEL